MRREGHDSVGLIILDRDGVINEDSASHIRSPDEWIAIPGSLEAITRLQHAGYRMVVATNQSGIGRRFFDVETLGRIHEKMLAALAEVGGTIEAIFFCPHGPKEKCRCRKPGTGMLEEIADRLRTPLEGVPVIGDAWTDVEAARAVGARPILVRTGKGREAVEGADDLAGVEVFDDLAAVADHLLGSVPESAAD